MAERIKSSEAYSPIGGDMIAALARVTDKLIGLANVFDNERRGQRKSHGEVATLESTNIALALLELKNAITDLDAGARVAQVAAFKILSNQEVSPILREAIASIIDAGIEIRDGLEDSLYIPPVAEVAITNMPASVDPQYSPAQGQMFAQYQLNT